MLSSSTSSLFIILLIATNCSAEQLRKRSSSTEATNKNIRDINQSHQENQRGTIINGLTSEINDYPWFVKGGEGCGGSLISSFFILTTVSCVDYFNGARIGTLCRDEDNCGQAYERIGVKDDFFVHPDYDEETYGYDIALLQLKRESAIEPVDLDLVGISNDYTEETELWLAGMGNTIRNGRSPSYRLKHVQLNYVDETTCASSYPDDIIDDSMMCAIGEDRGSCFGDEGGPLYDENNRALVGIFSWAGRKCARENEPSVYSRISNAKVVSFVKNIVCNVSHQEVPKICIVPEERTTSEDLETDASSLSLKRNEE